MFTVKLKTLKTKNQTKIYKRLKKKHQIIMFPIVNFRRVHASLFKILQYTTKVIRSMYRGKRFKNNETLNASLK